MRYLAKVLGKLAEEFPSHSSVKYAVKQLLLKKRQEKAKAINDGELISKGPCLNCNDITDYTLSKFHKYHGNPWIIKLFASMKQKPLRVEWKHYSEWPDFPRKGNAPISHSFVVCFLCTDCNAQLERMIDAQRALIKQREATDHERYIAKRAMEQAEIESRRRMPYSDFLASDYWAEVRSEALRKARYACALCSAKNVRLHVHHKTYAHRGDELSHMGDLIVLCHECHEKFHDKHPEAV